MARTLTRGTRGVPAETNGQALGPPPARSALSRVRGSLALAVVLAIFAGLFYLAAASGHSGEQVAVAARDLRPGETLDAAALRYVDVSGSKALIATLLRPRDMSSVRGFVLVHAVATGSVVSRGDIAAAATAAGSQARSMSIPVDADHAAGGAVHVGDVVDVIDGGENNGAPSYAVTGVQVVAVSKPGGAGLGGSAAKSWITVALPDGTQPDGQAALRVAAAIDHAKIEVVRSTGAAALPPPPTVKSSSTPGARP